MIRPGNKTFDSDYFFPIKDQEFLIHLDRPSKCSGVPLKTGLTIFILLLLFLFLIICIMRQWTNLSFQLSIVCENVSH